MSGCRSPTVAYVTPIIQAIDEFYDDHQYPLFLVMKLSVCIAGGWSSIQLKNRRSGGYWVARSFVHAM